MVFNLINKMRKLALLFIFFLGCKDSIVEVIEPQDDGFIHKYYIDKDSLKQGEYIVYHPKLGEEKPHEIYNFKDGKLHGNVYFYNDIGNIESVSSFKNGKKDGKFILYYPHSLSIELEFEMVNNKLHGYYKRYYKNDKLMSISYFKDGLQDSISLVYIENGILIGTSNHELGKLHGFEYLFDYNQDTVKIKYYEHGKLITLHSLSDETNFGNIENGNGIMIKYYNDYVLEIIYQNGLPIDSIITPRPSLSK